MAWDEALMQRARRTGEAVLRVYSWSSPTLSLGRNQTARGAYSQSRAGELGVSFVRRPTGGRALLHHREITYSVTAPDTLGASLGDAYQRINALLVDALSLLGVPATVAAGAARTPLPGIAPCFDLPSRGEIEVGGRKLVGSAQWRHEGALLQHGSMLVHDDQSLIGALLSVPRNTSTPAAATLADILGHEPSVAHVGEVLVAALHAREAPDAEPLVPDTLLLNNVQLAAHRYGDDAWTWRR